jgi:uncharacterized protein
MHHDYERIKFFAVIKRINPVGINKMVAVVCTFILSIGILGAGYSVGKSVYLLKKFNRTITVKGLTQQDVKSDLGLLEINYREVGNDLTQIEQRLQHDQEVVTVFLKQQGFVDGEIDRTPLKVEDRLATIHNQSGAQNANDQRYVVTAGMSVRSSKVDQIQKTAQETNKLLQLGIQLGLDGSSLNPNPRYYYTQLDSIRPSMLTEAIKSARLVADQFAKDAGFKLAGIQHASQGVFQIIGRDTSTLSADWSSNQNALGSIDKKVRLVTTIDYRIK